MEGVYFFGEHLRWNLGWENPNQAGVFVAMWIPWFWGVGRVVERKWHFGSWLVLIAELVLWFLLCKTYSRGALVAIAAAGGFWFLGKIWMERSGIGGSSLSRLGLVRLAGVAVLLLSTGFFARIDPGYVSQDASAGNRLTLWEGGLRMIAVSPLRGWGKGESGSGFMQWFQPLEAKEAYAGMVNSYLHVGVEYGLPVLGAVLAISILLLGIALPRCGAGAESAGKSDWCRLAGGAALVVFLAANVFSTLWVFRDLWWVVAFSGLVMIAFFYGGGRSSVFSFRSILVGAGLLAALLCSGLFLAGKLNRPEVEMMMDERQNLLVSHRDGKRSLRILFYPDQTVLGESWGKEIRRMAADPKFRDVEITIPGGEISTMGKHPQVILVCGRHAEEGIAAAALYPEARLVLVHPLGKPDASWANARNMSVLLPGLDTTGGGGLWRRFCVRNDWECQVNPRVGQDVRLAWPRVLSRLRDGWGD